MMNYLLIIYNFHDQYLNCINFIIMMYFVNFFLIILKLTMFIVNEHLKLDFPLILNTYFVIIFYFIIFLSFLICIFFFVYILKYIKSK
jgi:hypothetical protein